MKRLAMAAAVTTVCAVPALGTFMATMVAPAEMAVGDTATIEVWGSGTTKGLWTMAGSVVASGDDVLSANAGSIAWVDPFTGHATFLMGAGSVPLPGTPGPKGGWVDFGTSQNVFPANETVGKVGFAKVATYTVTATGVGTVTLTFVDANANELGIGTSGGSNVSPDNLWGPITPATVTVVPEPVTLALLALGGLVAARRRGR